MNLYDVIIIGSGPAGLTAAIYTSRSFLKTAVFSGNKKGGQLMDTTMVENYPGFPEGIMGPDLMEKMIAQAKRFKTEIIDEDVVNVEFTKHPFEINNKYKARSIIVATGASHKELGIPEENKFKGHGVSYCATCDGFFFKDKVIAVLGGGDTAMEEANFLSKFGKKIYVIHRRHEFRASKIMIDKVMNNSKVEVVWDHVVKELKGNEKLQSIVLQSTVDKKDVELQVDGLFVAIGLKPNTSFIEGFINLDEKGYILKNKEENEYSHMTSVDGVFVAGDVSDPVYRQAVTAAGDGCAAALEVEKWLNEN